MNINLYIEHIVLDGIDVAQRDQPALQRAVEVELARLLANGGLSSNLQVAGEFQALTTRPIQLSNQPGHLGQQIAQAVYGGLRW